MSIVDSLKDFFMPEDELDADGTPASSSSASSESAVKSSSASSSYNSRPAQPVQTPYEREQEKARARESVSKNEHFTSSMASSYTPSTNYGNAVQVVLVRAKVYAADSKKVADYLLENKTVVLNLEEIDEENKRRIVDFVVGAAYATHGRIRPIANQTFLIIPQNVGFEGDNLADELQGRGI